MRSKSDDLVLAGAAALLFALLFIFRGAGRLDFWWWMSANVAFLVALSAARDADFVRSVLDDLRGHAGRKILFGALSAVVLYGVFFAGNGVSLRLLPFAGAGISRVYALKQGTSMLRVVLLLALLIGPGEELFWRGFLQRRWQLRFGRVRGFLLAAALYALVHAANGNLMLVLAAAVCGLFWGYLYLRTNSVLLVAVSHTLWDLMVFVLFPLS